MRKLVVIEYVSLDGVIQAPGHAGEDPEGGFAHGGWTGPLLADHRRFNSDSFQTAGAFLLGRITYEISAGYHTRAATMTTPLNGRASFVACGSRDPRSRSIHEQPHTSRGIYRPLH